MQATCDCPCPCHPEAVLIASSTIPPGEPTQFSVRAPGNQSSWRLCDLGTNRSARANAEGVATWASGAEDGSVLLFAATTPCHELSL